MKAVVSFSGGIDSTTTLANAIGVHGKENVAAISFKYPSLHNRREVWHAGQVAAAMGVYKWAVVDVSGIIFPKAGNTLVPKGDNPPPVPEGHYTDESMKSTVVPGRNLIFASILAGIAEAEGASEVWLGIHAGDHAIYPDCRPAFYRALREVVCQSTDDKVKVLAPYLNWTKDKIVKHARDLMVPLELTWTCYNGRELHCGKCGACTERKEAFVKAGVTDPTTYEDSK
jgi:7-cyano-7-deazaguanine synthase